MQLTCTRESWQDTFTYLQCVSVRACMCVCMRERGCVRERERAGRCGGVGDEEEMGVEWMWLRHGNQRIRLQDHNISAESTGTRTHTHTHKHGHTNTHTIMFVDTL